MASLANFSNRQHFSGYGRYFFIICGNFLIQRLSAIQSILNLMHAFQFDNINKIISTLKHTSISNMWNFVNTLIAKTGLVI